MTSQPIEISVIDSHTGGEPTRMVIAGGPDLCQGERLSVGAQLERLRRDHDQLRSALVTEPRTTPAAVGALLCPPENPEATTGVIFFNNAGYLGGCIHGTLGVVRSLAFLGRLGPGEHLLETPVGTVKARLLPDGRVAAFNVPSSRAAAGVAVEVPGRGTVRGDIAWGGNWFFLIAEHGQSLRFSRVAELTAYAADVMLALETAGIRGADGRAIDHVELFSDEAPPGADSRNFVLCPGLEYDRSPCGTGTSAKLACLYADGQLAPGAVWRQAGILGSIFEGRLIERDGELLPEITGSAWVTGRATVILDPTDPFRAGITAGQEL